MASRTNTVDGRILATMYPLKCCQAKTPSFPPANTSNETIEGGMEYTEDFSRLALHAIDSIIVEKRRRMRIGLRNAIPAYGISISEDIEDEEKEDEDVGIEELGTLALRARDSVHLIRRDSEKNWTARAKSRMSRKDKVRNWFLGQVRRAQNTVIGGTKGVWWRGIDWL